MARSSYRRERLFAVLPTLLTLGNAACGFGSITFATKIGPTTADGNALFIAALLILAAMVFDMLDGHTARWTKQTSEFGAQLDSLCDAISFGAAPAFLMLKFVQGSHPRLLWLVAVLYVLCAVLRLARFNVQLGEEDAHDSFVGLPSPAAAGTIASFVIVMPELVSLTEPSMPETTQQIAGWLITASRNCLPVLTLVLACLMVSRIRYPHVARQLLLGRQSYRHLVQLIFSLIAVFAVHELAIPLILCYFALASPLRALWTKANVRGLWRPRPGRAEHKDVRAKRTSP